MEKRFVEVPVEILLATMILSSFYLGLMTPDLVRSIKYKIRRRKIEKELKKFEKGISKGSES